MENKIDLHIHTYYSDGTSSPTEIVKWAKEKKLDQISITDHDGIDGVFEAKIAGEALDIDVIPGIELSASFGDGISVHILGYYIDVNNNELNETINTIRERRKERNERLIEALFEMGYQIGKDDIVKKGNIDYIGKPDFARALLKRGYIETFKEAFEEGKFLMSKEIKKIKKEKISAKEAIELITHAGGIAVLAHPMKIEGLDIEEIEKLVAQLKVYGLKGIECYYPSHSQDDIFSLVSIAEKYKLHITKGTDYHGPIE